MKKKKDSYVSLSTINKIIFLHEGMKELSVKAGIQEPKYAFIIKNLEKRLPEYHDILLNWLEAFRDNEYKEARLMWAKFSDHGWDNLKNLLGTHDLPEQKLLENKFKTLREKFINWPRPEKKRVRKNGNI